MIPRDMQSYPMISNESHGASSRRCGSNPGCIAVERSDSWSCWRRSAREEEGGAPPISTGPNPIYTTRANASFK